MEIVLHGKTLEPLLREFSLPQLGEVTGLHQALHARLDDLL